MSSPPRQQGQVVVPLFTAAVRPLQAFFRLEAASGIVLLGCAVVALAWVNLGGAESYHAIFGAPITVGIAGAVARFSLLQLVNDGLMTIFFFVVGMEIKRELIVGELRSFAQASLPAIAAVGGMVVPAAVFLAFNWGGPGHPGWGVPMATDIAFCIGVLTLLRSRVPHALVVFVTALAIFDDIGGILVIALFYGEGLSIAWLAAAGAIVAAVAVMAKAYVRSGMAYAVAGALLWYALHHAGIHATIAGVILGLAIPARPRRSAREVLEGLAAHSTEMLREPVDEELQGAAVAHVDETLEHLEPPLTRFIHALHRWVAFAVMPLFALANAGVDLRSLEPSQLTGRIAVGTALALFVGKQVGIFAFTWCAVRLGLGAIPGGSSPAKLFGVSIVAGIGFTVALFIAGLAYPGRPELLDEAKVGILAGSLIAGLAGAAVLRLTARVATGGAGGAERVPTVAAGS